MRNYKSAILSIHRGFQDGTTLNDGNHLALLLDGMFNERPPQRTLVPTWELDVVLNYLKGPPFEPLRTATLKHLTLKTAFLVTLASGRRCSEVHALSAGMTRTSAAGVSLFYRPGFLAKNESANFQHSHIYLPKMSMSSSIHEDRLWCPVRAVTCYIDRTASIRLFDICCASWASSEIYIGALVSVCDFGRGGCTAKFSSDGTLDQVCRGILRFPEWNVSKRNLRCNLLEGTFNLYQRLLSRCRGVKAEGVVFNVTFVKK